MHRSQYEAVKHCFIIENLCDKSGEVVSIKSLLIDFIPTLALLQNKAHCWDAYEKHDPNI